MPGALGRLPGWRRRGCRRLPRTGRTARSRRSATRSPHQAGPVRSRHGGLLRPAPRTGASCFPGRGRCTRQGPLAESLQGQRVSPAGPAPVQRVRRDANQHLAGEGVISRVQGRKLAHLLEDVSVAGEPVEQDPAGGHRVPGNGPLPGRHITTVRQNHRSPGGLTSGCPQSTGAAAVPLPARHTMSLPYELVTHLTRRSGSDPRDCSTVRPWACSRRWARCAGSPWRAWRRRRGGQDGQVIELRTRPGSGTKAEGWPSTSARRCSPMASGGCPRSAQCDSGRQAVCGWQDYAGRFAGATLRLSVSVLTFFEKFDRTSRLCEHLGGRHWVGGGDDSQPGSGRCPLRWQRRDGD